MTRRLVIGAKGTSGGIWLSKPGFDALTAADANMLLSIDVSAEQLIMFGSVSPPLPQTVPLGLTQRPFVLLTTRSPNSIDDGGARAGEVTMVEDSYWRPFPLDTYETFNSQAVVGTASMTISGGGSQPRLYMVFRRRLN